MKEYKIELCENGWEYTGHINIKAESVEKAGARVLVVNGAIIEFDEEVIIKG